VPAKLEKELVPVKVGPDEWSVECPSCKKMSSPSHFPTATPTSCEYCGRIFRKRTIPHIMQAKKAAATVDPEDFSTFHHKGEVFQVSGMDEKGYRHMLNNHFELVGKIKFQDAEWKITYDDPTTKERKEKIIPYKSFPEEQINAIIDQLKRKNLNPEKELVNADMKIKVWGHGEPEKGSPSRTGKVGKQTGWELTWDDYTTGERTGRFYPLGYPQTNLDRLVKLYQEKGLGPQLKTAHGKTKWPEVGLPPGIEKSKEEGPVQTYLKRHGMTPPAAPKRATKITKTAGLPKEVMTLTKDQLEKLATLMGTNPQTLLSLGKKKIKVIDEPVPK